MILLSAASLYLIQDWSRSLRLSRHNTHISIGLYVKGVPIHIIVSIALTTQKRTYYIKTK
jgi:hypothetical protein